MIGKRILQGREKEEAPREQSDFHDAFSRVKGLPYRSAEPGK